MQHVKFDLAESSVDTLSSLEDENVTLLERIQQQTIILLNEQQEKQKEKTSIKRNIKYPAFERQQTNTSDEATAFKEEHISRLNSMISKLKSQLLATETLKESIVRSYTITLSEIDSELQFQRVRVIELEELLEQKDIDTSNALLKIEQAKEYILSKNKELQKLIDDSIIADESKQKAFLSLQCSLSAERQNSANLQVELQRLNLELTKYKTSMELDKRELAKSETVIKDLKIQLKQAENNDKLKLKLAALESRSLRSQAIEYELEELRTELDSVNVKLNEAEKHEAALIEELSFANNEVANLNVEKQNLQNEINKLEKQLQQQLENNNECDQLRVQVNSMKTKHTDELKDLTDRLLAAQSQLESKTNQVFFLEKELKRQKQQNKVLVLKQEEITESLVLRLKNQLSQITAENVQIKRQLSNEKINIKKLMQKEEELIVEMNSAQQIIHNLQMKFLASIETQASTKPFAKLESTFSDQVKALEAQVDSFYKDTLEPFYEQQRKLKESLAEEDLHHQTQTKILKEPENNKRRAHKIKDEESIQEDFDSSITNLHKHQSTGKNQVQQLADIQKDTLTENLKAQIQELNLQLDREIKVKEESFTKLAEIEKENTKLVVALTEARAKVTDVQSQNSLLDGEIELLKQEYQKQAKDNESLNSQLTLLNKQKGVILKQLEDEQNLKEQIKIQVESEKISTQTQLTILDSTNQELNNQVQSLQMISQEEKEKNESLLEKLKQEEKTLEETKSQLQSSIANFEQEIKALSTEKETLNRQIKEMQVSLDNEMKSKQELQHNLTEMMTTSEIKRKEIEEVTEKQNINAQQMLMDIKAVKVGLSQQNHEIQILLRDYNEQLLKTKSSVLMQVAAWKTKFDTLQNEKEETNAAIYSLKAKNESLLRKVNEGDLKCKSLLHEKTTLSETIDTINLELNNCKQEFANEKRSLQNELNILNANAKDLKAKLIKLRKENEATMQDLMKQKEEVEKRISSLSDKLANSNEQLKVTKEQIEALEKTNDTKHAKLTEELSREQNSTDQKLKDYEKKMMKSSEYFNTEIEILKNEVKKLNNQLQHALEAKEIMFNELNTTKVEKEELITDFTMQIKLKDAEIEENMKKAQLQLDTEAKKLKESENQSSQLQKAIKEVTENQVAKEKQRLLKLQVEIQNTRSKLNQQQQEIEVLLKNYGTQDTFAHLKTKVATYTTMSTEREKMNVAAVHSLKVKNDELLQKLNESESNCKSLLLENTNLSEKNDAISLELENRKNECRKLQNELNTCISEAETKELESKLRKEDDATLQDVVKQKEELGEKITVLKGTLSSNIEQLKCKEEHIKLLEESNSTKQKELTEEIYKEQDITKQKVQEYETKMELLNTEMEKTRSLLQDALNENEVISNNLKKAKEQNEDLLRNEMELRVKLESKDTEIKGIKMELTKLEEKVKKTESEANTELTALKENYSNEIMLFQEKLKELTSEKASVAKNKEAVESLLEKEKQTKQQIEVDLERHRRHVGKLLEVIMDKHPSLLENISFN